MFYIAHRYTIWSWLCRHLMLIYDLLSRQFPVTGSTSQDSLVTNRASILRSRSRAGFMLRAVLVPMCHDADETASTSVSDRTCVCQRTAWWEHLKRNCSNVWIIGDLSWLFLAYVDVSERLFSLLQGVWQIESYNFWLICHHDVGLLLFFLFIHFSIELVDDP